MIRIDLEPIVTRQYYDLLAELEKYGFEYIFGVDYLEELYFETASISVKDNSIYVMDIQTFIRHATDAGYVSEADEEEFLLDYLLDV